MERQNDSTYTHARAAVQVFWDQHSMPVVGQAGKPMSELLDQITLVVIEALASRAKPKISPHAMAAFHRIMDSLGPEHARDAQLVHLELLGRAPLDPEGFPQALRASMGAVRAEAILELAKRHGWGPLRRRQGRTRIAPTRIGYCARHGAGVEQRQYLNGKGKKGFSWRCMKCMGEAKARHQENKKARSSLTTSHGADSLSNVSAASTTSEREQQ